MKTINKKHILAGLLLVAAMAPAKTECLTNSPLWLQVTTGYVLANLALKTIDIFKKIIGITPIIKLYTNQYSLDNSCTINPDSKLSMKVTTTYKEKIKGPLWRDTKKWNITTEKVGKTVETDCDNSYRCPNSKCHLNNLVKPVNQKCTVIKAWEDAVLKQ